MKVPILFALLIIVPLSSTERRLEVGLVIGQAQAREYSSDLRVSEGWVVDRFSPNHPTTLGLRFGVDLVRVGKSNFQLTATWQPKANADLRIVSDEQGQFSSFHRELSGKYGYQYLAVGGRFTWAMPLELGLGLELRSEKVEFSGPGLRAESASLSRPWLTCHLGHTWARTMGDPFLRLELGLPLTKEAPPDRYGYPPASSDDFIGPTAPKSHLMLVAGFRF
jgi:hypothetical protein